MSKSGIPIVKDVAGVVGDVVKPLAPVLKTVAPILPFIPIPGIAGLSPLLTRSLLSGVLGGLDKNGGFNFGSGLKTGLLSYGLGSLMGAGQGDAAKFGGGDIGSAADPTGLDLSGIPEGTPTALTSSGDVSLASSYTGPGSMAAPAPTTGGAPVISSGYNAPAPAVPAGQPAPITDLSFQPNSIPAAAPVSTTEGIANLTGAVGDTALNLGSRAVDYALANPIQTALGATTAYGSYKSMQELEKAKEEADRILRDQENKKASDIAWAQSVLRDYPLEYRRLSASDVMAQRGMAMGGLTALAGGGRYLRGPGDGTSDSIPARIGGRQEARLADGEFVIDARTVSELGNGSSNAGAKKLYQMMDRVHSARRKAQRGQPSGAEKYMPA
jgi:hypothetical protein